MRTTVQAFFAYTAMLVATCRAQLTSCYPGTFYFGGGCQYCDAGKYQDLYGQISCKPCTSGYAYMGSDRCYPFTNCRRGQYLAEARTAQSDSVCLDCDPGTYSDVLNAAACSVCPSGKYQPRSGQASCIDYTVCVPGQRTNIGGTTTADRGCTACVSPWTTTSGAQTACTDCVVGMYKLGSSPGSCVACTCGGGGELYINCPAGSNAKTCSYCTGTQPRAYCAAGLQPSAVCDGTQTQDTTCVACPAGTHKPIADSRSCVLCPTGYYKASPSTGSCASCSNKPANAEYVSWTAVTPPTQPTTSNCPW